MLPACLRSGFLRSTDRNIIIWTFRRLAPQGDIQCAPPTLVPPGSNCCGELVPTRCVGDSGSICCQGLVQALGRWTDQLSWPARLLSALCLAMCFFAWGQLLCFCTLLVTYVCAGHMGDLG
ncbi:hypothetical protein CRENBAI_015626 [Crenichthys baileyi]|uniref:Uncharacterized protein n=1 Tax=Crenichthys baileyi TaxID=28760 RepID=A0AAV9SPD4_9TELE